MGGFGVGVVIYFLFQKVYFVINVLQNHKIIIYNGIQQCKK